MTELVKLPHQQCYKAIENVALNEGFTEYNLEISPGSSKGDNYMGNMWRIKVTSKNLDKKLNLILKSAPTEEKVRQKIPVDIIYSREIVAYKEVLKALSDLQDTVSISADLKFSFVKCYLTSDELTKELLILEDMKTQGFETLKNLSSIELDHVRLVITSIAKLHALSFVLQKKDLAQFIILANKCKPDVVERVDGYFHFLRTSLDLALTVVENPVYRDKIMKHKKTFKEDWKACLEADKYAVICHGDCWTNNVMFKSKEGKPVDCRMHDYQILRYGLPATDLLYFIFTSTDGELRKAHYTTLLDLYHETLADVLNAYGHDIKEVFPRDEFNKQVKTVAKYAFVCGISAIKPMVLDKDDTMEVQEMLSDQEMAPPKGAAYDRYFKKLTDIIADCIEYGYV